MLGRLPLELDRVAAGTHSQHQGVLDLGAPAAVEAVAAAVQAAAPVVGLASIVECLVRDPTAVWGYRWLDPPYSEADLWVLQPLCGSALWMPALEMQPGPWQLTIGQAPEGMQGR